MKTYDVLFCVRDRAGVVSQHFDWLSTSCLRFTLFLELTIVYQLNTQLLLFPEQKRF